MRAIGLIQHSAFLHRSDLSHQERHDEAIADLRHGLGGVLGDAQPEEGRRAVRWSDLVAAEHMQFVVKVPMDREGTDVPHFD